MSEPRKRSAFRVVAPFAMALGGVAPATASETGDELEAPEAFEVCTSCHAYAPDEPPLEGPSLWQVAGRRIASLEGFEYSAALSQVEGRWDRATLDRFLTSPQAFAPGTRMKLGGVRSAADRAVVLDFLESLVPGADSKESEEAR